MKQGISVPDTRPNSAHQINLPVPLPAMAHKPRQYWLYGMIRFYYWLEFVQSVYYSTLSTADETSFYYIHVSVCFSYHTQLICFP